MSDDRSMQVSRTLDVPADQVFALLSSPGRHTELDGAGMLRGLDSGPDPVTAVGDAFVMNMNQDGIGDYQMRNEVTELEAGRRIAWAPSVHPHGALSHIIGETDPSGHVWVWDLVPDGESRTTVTHTYDWSGVRDESALGLYPRVSTADMEGSLDRLVAALG